MRALKTVFWILVVVALFAFTYANDSYITIHLWPGISVDTKPWVLVIVALLIGFVPTSLMLRATRWSMGRRIANLEATLAAQAHALTHPRDAATGGELAPGHLTRDDASL